MRFLRTLALRKRRYPPVYVSEETLFRVHEDNVKRPRRRCVDDSEGGFCLRKVTRLTAH